MGMNGVYSKQIIMRLIIFYHKVFTKKYQNILVWSYYV
jgi:hypothetical protein